MKKSTSVSENSQTSNQSTEKLLTIMECLAACRFPVRLQDIADQTGLSQATVLRYLSTLIKSNYVYKDQSMRYCLTWKVCKLSDNVHSNLNLRNISGSIINDLSNTLRLGVCLVINHNEECMYLDCVDDSASLTSTLQRIGIRTPMHASSSGKVLLSALSDEELQEYIDRGLEKLTDATITDGETLKKEIENVRRQGYGTEVQECEMNLRCVAFPIKDYSGNIVAAMSVFGKLRDMTDERIQNEVIPNLSAATMSISERLGFNQE